MSRLGVGPMLPPTGTFWLGTNAGLTRIVRFVEGVVDIRFPGYGQPPQ